MPEQTAAEQATRDIERRWAAWESATVQTLNPLLSAAGAAALWAAILGTRSTSTATTFAEAVPAILAAEPPSAFLRRAADDSVAALRAILTPAQE